MTDCNRIVVIGFGSSVEAPASSKHIPIIIRFDTGKLYVISERDLEILSTNVCSRIPD